MNETLLFGLTMLVVGMGGTLVTLSVIALILRVLTMIFPAEPEKHEPVERQP